MKISERELVGLEKRHGADRLLQAADIAAETWRRNREEKRNPDGYLNTLCASLVVPDWYVPYTERAKNVEELQHRKEVIAAEQKAAEASEQEKVKAQNDLWGSLSETQREQYRMKALKGLPAGVEPANDIQVILASSLAWEEAQSGDTGC